MTSTTPEAEVPLPAAVTTRRLGRDTMVYTIGILASRLLSLLMLPLYTRSLTPADYGILQLLEMTVDIGTLLIGAGMTAGLQRFVSRTQAEAERRSFIASAFALEVGLGLLTTTLLVALAPKIWLLFLRGEGELEFIQIAAVTFSFTLLAAVPLQVLQIERRSVAFITITLSKLVAQIALNILFVVKLRMGVLGVLATSFLTNGLLGIGLSLWLLKRNGLRPTMVHIRDLRRFGLPYQATFIGSFVMTFGDRYFLQASHGPALVGVYSLAYSFGFLLFQVGASPFLSAWNPQRFDQLSLDEGRRNELYQRAFHLFNFGLLVAAVSIGLAVRPGLRVIAGPDFQGAAVFVPLVLLAYVLQAWTDVVKFGIDVSGETRYFSYASWASMALTIALYALLIPPFGGFGAAIATAGGFALRFGLAYHWSQRLHPVPYDWIPVTRLLLVGSALIIFSFALPQIHFVPQTALHVTLLAGFLLTVWYRYLDGTDRAHFGGLVRARLLALRGAR